MRQLLAFVAVFLALPVAGVQARASATHIIVGDTSIGGFKPYDGFGQLSKAIGVFGEPSTLKPGSDSSIRICTATWKSLGLVLRFNAYKGGCIPEGSCLYEAVVTGTDWRTAKGLKIRDPRQKLYRLYPNVKARGPWRTLLTRPGLENTFPAVEAKLSGTHVVAFRISTSSCEGFFP